MKTRFNLPSKIIFCKSCVMSNQRPSSISEFFHIKERKGAKYLNINKKDGICDGCKQNYFKEKKIDWTIRQKKLVKLLDKYRKSNGEYDCLVPGSGGKDSAYQAHILKYKYGMNPLVVTWPPILYTEYGLKNYNNWINIGGFDSLVVRPNGRVMKKLTKLSILNLLHPFQTFILGQKNIAPKIAAKFDIKLVFYGENEAEYGNPKVQNNDSKVSAALYESHLDIENFVLGGVKVKELIENYGVKLSELQSYLPLEKGDPNKISNLDFRYLGYYLKWHPQSCYYYSVDNCDFEAAPERTVGTYSKYNSIDDKVDDLHYYTTYIKFGIGRATYDAAQEIRSKDIEREEGVSLVKKFDGEYPERFQKEIFEYLSLNKRDFSEAYSMFEQPKFDRKYFDNLCDNFRSAHIWYNENGKWYLRKTVF